jgi:hypothetical protein
VAASSSLSLLPSDSALDGSFIPSQAAISTEEDILVPSIKHTADLVAYEPLHDNASYFYEASAVTQQNFTIEPLDGKEG